jgi:hypothetical protein
MNQLKEKIFETKIQLQLLAQSKDDFLEILELMASYFEEVYQSPSQMMLDVYTHQ